MIKWIEVKVVGYIYTHKLALDGCPLSLGYDVGGTLRQTNCTAFENEPCFIREISSSLGTWFDENVLPV